MRRIIKDFIKVKFVQDVGFLQFSTICCALINLLVLLIIAKSLIPVDFGIYSLVLSLFTLVAMLSGLGLKQAALVKLSSLLLDKDKEYGLLVLGYYFKASLAIGIVIMVSGYIFAPHITKVLYNREDIARFYQILFWIPLAIIPYKLVGIILEGTRRIRHLAFLEIISVFIRATLLITIVSLGFGLLALLYAWLISTLIVSFLTVFSYEKFREKEELPSISEIIKKSYLGHAKKFLKFNLTMGLSEGIISLTENLPVILLGIFVLPQEVGYFKLGFSILGASMLFLEPVTRNLLLKLRQLYGNHKTKELVHTFYKVFLYVGFISLLLISAIIILYNLVVYSFLKEYLPSLRIIYLLAGYFFISGCGSALSPVLRALERLDIEIKINAIGLLIFMALSLSLTRNLGISGMAIALVISALFTKFSMYLSVKNLLKPETL